MGLFKYRAPANRLERRLRRKARHYRYRWWRRGFLALLFIGLLGAGGVGYVYYKTPPLENVFKSAQETKLFDRSVNVRYLNSDGKQFYQSNDSTFKPLTVSETKQLKLPIRALTATEDRDYFNEGGVNYKRTVKAAVDTVLGKGVSGGSTITQQLIKLAFFSTDKKDQTVSRKAKEIILAEQLAHKYSKYQILTWYLNKSNFGNNQQGLYAAANFYYRKKPQDLNTLQAATLIGIVNSPASYNPYTRKQAMTYRRNVVLYSMYEADYLSKSNYQKLKKKSIDQNLVLAKTNTQERLATRQKKLQYNGFVSAVNTQLGKYDQRLANSNVTIKTTMNQGLQDKVNQLVQKQSYPDDKFQEAIVVLNSKTGAVEAMSGGRQQTVLGGYNRAYSVKRSSGSSIKPLLDFGPGFELYNWSAKTMVDDSPYNYPRTKTAVHDYDNRYAGSITLARALTESRNIPAVKALVKVGLPNGQKVLSALGLPNSNLYYANAIGLDTSPVSLASGFSALANNGKRSNARFVESINNRSNQEKMDMASEQEQVYSPDTAYRMTNVLKGVFKRGGSAGDTKLHGVNHAGKTGTVGRENQSGLTDGWMIGYTKEHVVAVWVGYDNPYDKDKYLTDKTEKIARDLYKSVMMTANKLPGSDQSDWKKPDKKKTDNFMTASQRQNSYLPFKLSITPAEFFQDQDDSAKLTELYQKIDQADRNN